MFSSERSEPGHQRGMNKDPYNADVRERLIRAATISFVFGLGAGALAIWLVSLSAVFAIAPFVTSVVCIGNAVRLLWSLKNLR